ncbi:MAG: hypothetical protein WCC04_10940 [Terriglobales bacterium]
MLGIMYTITTGKIEGVILHCQHCSHVERVNEFDDRFGNRRTQAADAMLKHVRSEHGKEPTGKPNSQIMERRY